MRWQKQPLCAIAQCIRRTHTTLSRELTRNTGGKGYRYQQAHHMASKWHNDKAKALKLTDTLIASLQDKLQARWSTEQICGRLLLEHGLVVVQ